MDWGLQNLTELAGMPVEDFDLDKGIADPEGVAYRVRVGWDEDQDFETKLGALLESPQIRALRGLVIGAWMPDDPSTSVQAVLDQLVAAAPKLSGLRALMVADLSQEECEVSWIEQGDNGPLLDALPKLRHFRVRGGSGLQFSGFAHAELQSLVIETGGMSKDAVRDVATADLPELMHLELWLGTDAYGGSSTMDDLEPLIAEARFPKLDYLGFRNAQDVDMIADAMHGSPWFGRISSLDLSLGELTDRGGRALLANPDLDRLNWLDLHYHYMTAAVVEQFKDVKPVVDTSEGQDPEEEYRTVWVSE